jgi:hypothetical protein
MGVSYDAIVVLGGGLRENGELPVYARRRLDLALALESGEPIVALSAGTTHRPAIVDADGRLQTESRAGARYLIDRGIRADRIFCEATSYDTIGNAYFSRVQIVEPLEWTRLLVITSRFHMPRAEAVFRWVYGLDGARYDLEFAASPDEGLSEAGLSARRTWEQQSLARVRGLCEKLTSLRSLAGWLFREHGAYQAVLTAMPADAAELLESY